MAVLWSEDGDAGSWRRVRRTAWLRRRLEARMAWRAAAPDRVVVLVRAAAAAQAQSEADALDAFRMALRNPVMATRPCRIG